MALVYLGLGSNLGEKTANVTAAIQHVSLEVGDLISTSSLYASAPWGYDSENSFVNAVIAISTELTPEALITKLQDIERGMGKTKATTTSYNDRVIDIDILLYENRIINLPELTIPHKHLHKRDFVLIPIAEIAPDLMHPILGKTMMDLSRNFRSLNRS